MKNLLLNLLTVVGAIFFLAACSEEKKAKNPNLLQPNQIHQLIPNHKMVEPKQKSAWVKDIHVTMKELSIPTTKKNVCQVLAVVEQESNFAANPKVPNLGKATLTAMQDKLKIYPTALQMYINKIMSDYPTPNNNYKRQMLNVQDERQLYLLQRRLVDDLTQGISKISELGGVDIKHFVNEIKTLGSMQVHLDYALENAKNPLLGSKEMALQILDNRKTGLYFGIKRLYEVDYENPAYRFADYNSGAFSSRNAAFQHMLMKLSGQKLTLDGDLLNYRGKSQTKTVLIDYFSKYDDAPSSLKISADLLKEKKADFEKTETYLYVVNKFKKRFPNQYRYAMMPQVELKSSKLKNPWNTEKYVRFVNERYQRCMKTKTS